MIDEKVLIKRLEKESYFTPSTFDEDGYSNDDSEEVIDLCRAITIVNQLAEEHNNGWIPCAEKLPKETNDYLVTQYNKNAIDEYCDGYKVETIFFDEDGWWDDTDYYCGWEIIAWQPLPAPYKENDK